MLKNVSLTIKYSMLLCFGIQGIVASDVSKKREIEILQATKLLPSLAALVNAYHGSAYYKGFFRLRGNQDFLSYDTNLFHAPHSCFWAQGNDSNLFVGHYFMRKDKADIPVNDFDQVFMKEGDLRSNPMAIENRFNGGNIQLIARMLARQKAITNATRLAHPEIPFPDALNVAACELNNKVYVISAGDGVKIWPLDYEDPDELSQQKPSCSEKPSIDHYDKHTTQTSQPIPVPCPPLLAEAAPGLAIVQRATSVEILPVRIASYCAIS